MKLKEEVKLAKEALLNGGVVAFPTETVMGLGVIYNNPDAYEKLNKIKGRPENKPYTLMVKSVDDIKYFANISDATQRVIDVFMPGPLTILVPLKKNSVPTYVTHGTEVIGIRVPTNEEAIKLLEEVEIPLLVPSANKSGEAPCLNSQETLNVFGDEIDFIITGKALKEQPSTIVDLTEKEVKVVREGPIKKEEIERIYKNL